MTQLQEEKEVTTSLLPLKLLVCGSVDDGKSTLIGRLLLDADAISEDQLTQVRDASSKYGTLGGDLDPALITDGLQDEREQGITIDIAWRYFTTPTRRIVLIDAPGHEQFTSNMATGASHADAAVLLIDARKGVLPQTKRHGAICALMGVKRVLLAVNKMDLVDCKEDVYENIIATACENLAQVGISQVEALPIIAREGDMIINRYERLNWYDGMTLTEWLHALPAAIEGTVHEDFRFPVQTVIRPNLDFRGFAGRIKSGKVKVGQEITVASSGVKSKVAEIWLGKALLEEAYTGQSVTLVLEDEIDITRGDVLYLSHERTPPVVGRRFDADLVWTSDIPLTIGQSVWVRSTTAWTPGKVTAVHSALDIDTLTHQPIDEVTRNDIVRVHVETVEPLALDSYATLKGSGSFVIVDRMTHSTLAAGMVRFVEPLKELASEETLETITSLPIDEKERASLLGYWPDHWVVSGNNAEAFSEALTRHALTQQCFVVRSEASQVQQYLSAGAIAIEVVPGEGELTIVSQRTGEVVSFDSTSLLPSALNTLWRTLRMAISQSSWQDGAGI